MRLLMILSSVLLSTAACQTMPGAKPALLKKQDAAAMDVIRQTLADAMGQAQVQLGPYDLTERSVISVLPPGPTALQGNNPALPEIFELVIEEGACALRRQRDNALYPLSGVTCKVAR